MSTLVLPVTSLSPLCALDGRDVPGSREAHLYLALDRLWRSCCPEDQIILSPLGSFLAAHAAEVAHAKQASAGQRGPSIPKGSFRAAPVATALLQFSAQTRPPGLTCLTAVLAAAALEVGNELGPRRKLLASFSSVLRGAYKEKGSALHLLIREVSSIPALIRGIEAELQLGDRKRAGHPGFEAEWRRWLRDTLVRWVRLDPRALADALRPKLAPDIEAPTVPISIAVVDGDPDGAADVEIYSTEPEAEGSEALPLAIARVVADAKSRFRSSRGDLLAPPDHFAPEGLIAELAQSAFKAAVSLAEKGDLARAEAPAALAFSIATGLREVDLSTVLWGVADDDQDLVLDLNRPVLHRKVHRPPSAVEPPAHLKGWLAEWTDRIAWPIPPGLHRVLWILAGKQPIAGACAPFPRRSANEHRHLLHWAAQEHGAGVDLDAPQIRLALAAELANRFGSEVAQLALADTFSMSVAPAYYTAQREFELVSFVASIQERWFGEAPCLPKDCGRTFGSKLVLTNDAARAWPTQLRKSLHKAESELEKWTAHSLYLAASLCAVTGARLVDALGELDLDQVIPEYCLVILRDKMVDALRCTRVAGTGRRWVSELRAYIDRLIRISEGAAGPESAELAMRILRSEAPLFALPAPGGGARLLLASDLRATMPEPLQMVANHYRHRLNQQLQRQGVDPELRHAQLGWVVSPAHTLANLSHYSARSFGEEICRPLDELMIKDGWFPASQRIKLWSWRGVPERNSSAWDANAAAFADEHRERIRDIRNRLRLRWKEVAPRITDHLAAAVAEYAPELTLDTSSATLRHATTFSARSAVKLTTDHYALLCERVRQQDEEPASAFEAVVARILLHRIVRDAKRRGVVQGPTPSRPYFRSTSEPSPFVPGLGLAIRLAEAARARLLERAAEGRAHDKGPIAPLSLLAFSPYRDLNVAVSAVNAASKAAWTSNRPHCLRVDATIDSRAVPLALGGLPALVLGSRGVEAPTARAPSPTQLGSWIANHLTRRSLEDCGDDELTAHIEELFRAAGRIELSGLERAVMIEHCSLAAVSSHRSLARDDDWEPRTALTNSDQPEREDGPSLEHADSPDAARSSGAALGARDEVRAYRKLTGLLKPEGLSKSTQSRSDGHRGWRSKLELRLADAEREVGPRTNVGLLHGFVRHRLRYGGAKKTKLAHITLGSELTRFGGDLLAVSRGTELVDCSESQYRDLYLATLLCKGESARSQAIDALMLFHGFLVQIHGAPHISFADLKKFAGPRRVSLNPGLATAREIALVFQELLLDTESERAKTDASPEALRSLELRSLLFLLLDGSGIRPRSAHGLTFGDVILLGPGRDYLRVRTTGEYGHVKTQASVGFVPLEGALWLANRDRVVDWLAQEKERTECGNWQELPLFSNAVGGRRRFSSAFLTTRIDALLKWATAEQKASTYWLRKGRISDRHSEVASKPRAKAREVHAVLCRCGHSDIETPLASYIGDPAIVASRHLHEGVAVPRAAVLATTGINGPQLDMAWLRTGGAHGSRRLAVVLERLGHQAVAPPAGRLTSPPLLRRAQSLLPRHVDAYARARQSSPERREALLISGVTTKQADQLDAFARDLLVFKGKAPWIPEGARHESAAFTPPRPLKGTGKASALLSLEPTAEICLLADSWVRQAHLARLHGSDVLMELRSDAELAAAKSVLAAVGVSLLIDVSSQCNVLRIPVRNTNGKSHAAAFRWILAVVWLYQRIAAGDTN